MKIDTEARYAKSHEWARKDGAELVVGISDHAQHSLGDIVYVDLPKVGANFAKGAAFGVVESVKAASDLYLPVAGKITAVNGALAESSDLINKDCYGQGWIVRLAPADAAEWESLLSPEDYEKIAAED
ncbi:MAG: glycine cleavage system protein H [Treponema sp. GWB1_62_6]|nr:MAG: glycine cleavage system protein H [Treponema sp. GWA1_62_8]OHE65262.1 MAG: glycine cleavage system protein H [Treponema sp. GWB1_62_6]OHE76433.1 MAG: glycine cleavage system protein H [Treponema sp. RIFOXYC1_FULL_61_9]HCM27225.1 glycine cleavage system protein GcvH [Treponema sp.]